MRISEDTYNFRTDTGELIYQTSAETLAEKEEPVMAFRSGNRVYFRDPNGGLVMKIFDGQNSGD